MRRLVVLVSALGALAVPALAHAAPPPIQRPNPAVYPVTLDYTNPLPGSGGAPATLALLERGVIVAATTDTAYLAFEKQGDLGGFVPASIGELALSGGGRNVLLPGTHKTQIPLFSQAAGGKISSFTFTGTNPLGGNQPPDNGGQTIPGIGVPTPPPPPTGSNTVPPANQGFGGRPGGNSSGGGTTTTPPTTTTTGGGGGTTTRPKPPPTTTTTGTTTTTATTATTSTGTTTTTATTTTTGGGGGGGGGGSSSACTGGSCAAGSCGVAGIQVDSTAAGCTISIANAAPGDSISEIWTITNTTGAAYTLSIKAAATNNHLTQDLQLGVWDITGSAPVNLPPLTSWLSGYSSLTTLTAGQTVQYETELFLPTTAGNADQNKTVSITFHWHAQG